MAVISKLPSLLGKKQEEENRLIPLSTLSEETGISRQTLTAWAKGSGLEQFRADTIERLCKYFRCKVGDLLEVIEDEPEGELIH
jgi:putative transcriptional regulator